MFLTKLIILLYSFHLFLKPFFIMEVGMLTENNFVKKIFHLKCIF